MKYVILNVIHYKSVRFLILVYLTRKFHMNPNLTDITLVVDRSGSMQGIHDDAEGGINAFITEQAQQPGMALLTLVQFDTEYEFIHSGVAIQQIPTYQLQPRGQTALLDAVGRAIKETGQRLANIPESDRPGLVVFVIVTDGHENASSEFTKTQIKEMIEHQQTVYKWRFTFLGADQYAFDEAQSMGINLGSSAAYARNRSRQAYAMSSSKLSRMRYQSSSMEEVEDMFTDEERAAMNDEDKKA